MSIRHRGEMKSGKVYGSDSTLATETNFITDVVVNDKVTLTIDAPCVIYEDANLVLVGDAKVALPRDKPGVLLHVLNSRLYNVPLSTTKINALKEAGASGAIIESVNILKKKTYTQTMIDGFKTADIEKVANIADFNDLYINLDKNELGSAQDESLRSLALAASDGFEGDKLSKAIDALEQAMDGLDTHDTTDASGLETARGTVRDKYNLLVAQVDASVAKYDTYLAPATNEYYTAP